MNILNNKPILKNSNIRKVAEYFLALDILKDRLDKEKKEIEAFLLENNVNEIFKEVEKKVIISTPKSKTFINKEKLYKYFKKNDRMKDFVISSNISQKNMEHLEDGTLLIAKFKETKNELTKSSVIISKLNKDEREL